MRFLHTADWQLGMSRRFLDPERQGQFDAARRDVLGTLGRLAVSEGCEAVVVGGDVFETNTESARTVRQAMEKLRDLPLKVFLLPGNHDPLNAASIWDSPKFRDACPDNVLVLRDGRPVQVRPGFEVVGAPWRSKRPTSDLLGDLLTGLDPAPPGVARVAVGHGAVDAVAPQADPVSLIRIAGVRAALEAGKAHYVALGDRHSTTEVTPRVWYSGAPEPTDFDEVDAGNVLIVELDEADPAAPPTVTRHRVGTWRFEPVTVEVSGAADVAALRARLAALPDKDRTVLNFALRGTLSVAEKEALDAVREEAADLFAGSRDSSSRTDLAIRPADDDFDTLGLTGFAARTLDDLRELAAGGDEAAARQASDALGLLVRLTGSGATSRRAS
ncbi:metallophosphoesterase family protein [Catenulispora pinisilvae]|uniref:metallophosphoesterase family protein n=1 Tax=Catenulispora pinisilvae TaxID=2705253 RepID=UPI001891D1E4|nr:exonuclease SbcCD subunit D [Catenulispora pinisilvae]